MVHIWYTWLLFAWRTRFTAYPGYAIMPCDVTVGMLSATQVTGGNLGGAFATCTKTPGVAGTCYNDAKLAGSARCVSTTELAKGRATCKGFSHICTVC